MRSCDYHMQGWLATACAKQAYFHAVAQHRQGLVAQANKNFGETVARTKVSACSELRKLIFPNN